MSSIKFIVFLGLLCIKLTGQNYTFNTTTLHGPYAGAEFLHIVLLGDGYTSSDLNHFYDDAQRVSDEILNTAPFSHFAYGIKISRIDVTSIESGTRHQNNTTSCANYCNSNAIARLPDTYFQSFYEADQATHRLLGRNNVDQQRAMTVLATNTPTFDLGFIISNSRNIEHCNQYGGSGGSIPTISSGTNAAVALHEIGHMSPFNLTDEYETGGFNNPYPGRNVQQNIPPRSSIKWEAFLDPSIAIPTPESECNSAPFPVGYYEGANYQTNGWFRPECTCKMRSSGKDFCTVCQSAITAEARCLVDFYAGGTWEANNSFNESVYRNIVISSIISPPSTSGSGNFTMYFGANESIQLLAPTKVSNGNHLLAEIRSDCEEYVSVQNGIVNNVSGQLFSYPSYNNKGNFGNGVNGQSFAEATSNQNSFNIFPNPVVKGGSLTIEFSEEYLVEGKTLRFNIFDLNYRHISKFDLRLDPSQKSYTKSIELSAGLYIMTCENISNSFKYLSVQE